MESAPKERKRIGIMGGTFDPIHYGHLHAAEEARNALKLSFVLFIPSGNPPHKNGRQITDAEDRFAMATLATIDCEYFSVLRTEIDRKGYSYTSDTLQALMDMPEYNDADFYFITGLDAVLDIMTWKSPHKIAELCKFVAVSRYGYNHGKLEELPENLRNAIIPLEIPLLAISSTELRARIKKGDSIKYLVPPAVEYYIKKKRLYGETYQTN